MAGLLVSDSLVVAVCREVCSPLHQLDRSLGFFQLPGPELLFSGNLWSSFLPQTLQITFPLLLPFLLLLQWLLSRSVQVLPVALAIVTVATIQKASISTFH